MSKSGNKKLRLNPILKKDLRVIARNMKFSWGLFAFEAVLGVIFLFAMLIMYESVGYTNMYSSMVALFPIIGGTELVIVALITPILTASAITSEKEKQTFDILLTTVMTPHAIIRGKLLSAVTRVMMFVVGSIPLMAISFTVGGVSWWALFAFLLLTLVFAIYVGSIGIMSSTFSNKSLVSIIISYVIYGLLSGGTFIPIVSISGIMGMSPEILSALSLLFNPLIMFITFFATVLGGEFIEDIFSSLVFVTAWGWIIVSLVMMIIASIVMQAIAASRINPVVGYRKKMKKKNRAANQANVNMAGAHSTQPAMVGGGMAGVAMTQPGMQMNMQNNGPMMQGQQNGSGFQSAPMQQNQSMFQGQPVQQNGAVFQGTQGQQGQSVFQGQPVQQNGAVFQGAQGQQGQSIFQGQPVQQNGAVFQGAQGQQGQSIFQSTPVRLDKAADQGDASQSDISQGPVQMGMQSAPVMQDHSIFRKPEDQMGTIEAQSASDTAVTQSLSGVQNSSVTQIQPEIEATPVTPVQTEIQSTPAAPAQTEILSTPVTPMQTEILSAPAAPMQTEILSTPVAPMQTEILNAPSTPMHTEILNAPVTPGQSETETASEVRIQPEAQSSPVTQEQPAQNEPLVSLDKASTSTEGQV